MVVIVVETCLRHGCRCCAIVVETWLWHGCVVVAWLPKRSCIMVAVVVAWLQKRGCGMVVWLGLVAGLFCGCFKHKSFSFVTAGSVRNKLLRVMYKYVKIYTFYY